MHASSDGVVELVMALAAAPSVESSPAADAVVLSWVELCR